MTTGSAPPRRDEFYRSLGITSRAFVDVTNTNRVGLIVEVPDVETYRQLMKTEPAAEAMRHDGVRPATIVNLVEA